MQEEVRNRLLRRTDWRFLLPDPNPARSLCLSDALAEPIGVISPHVARAGSDAERSGYEVAVATDPGPEALRVLYASLRLRGACYTEWRQAVSGGWRGVASRLEKAGFEQVTCYWARPDPTRTPATVWIPLENREPLDYYRTNRAPTRNLLRLAGRVARRVQWMLRPRRPICAVARKSAAPDTALRTDGREELIDSIQANWSRWGLGETPRRLSRILLAPPGRSGGKVVALLFVEGERSPRVAVKMARTPESAPGLLREAQVLRALERRPGGVPGIPRALLCRTEGIVVETAVSGLPLSGFLRRGNYRALAKKATEWLAYLAGSATGLREEWGEFVGRALADFESKFGAVLDPGLLRETAQTLAGLEPLPVVCEQRDFSPWNVLIDGEGRLSVLDWESAELHGLPALDLVYFLAYLAFYLDHALRSGRFRESFRRSLDAATHTGGVARDCLAWYAERTGLPRAALRPLRLLTWLLHSRAEHRRLVEDGGPRPDAERLRQSIFVNLWELELRHGDGF